MRKAIPAAAALGASALLLCAGATTPRPAGEHVRVVPDDANRRVDVLIGGQPFTSYIYPTTLKKPTLYPLRTAHGAIVTRGFPLDSKPGERVDHPHQVGLWFNYGNVNGLDFWNNSDAIKPANAPKMGTIYQRAVVSAKSGAKSGELVIEADWKDYQGKIVLRERTLFVFRGGPDSRSIDRVTTLTAPDQKVSFADDKEGVLGMRVTRALEEPSDKPEVFADASGRPTTVAKMDNTGVNGVYRSSEGKVGDAVWGTRGRWCMLSGNVGNEPVTIAILDHPGNPGFPTYWHARGYGLFAANPLGAKDFTNGKVMMNYALGANQSVTFRYRVLILSEIAKPEAIEQAYQQFAAEER